MDLEMRGGGTFFGSKQSGKAFVGNELEMQIVQQCREDLENQLILPGLNLIDAIART
jgi:transcription-repair coupling factor (superfamily II helicase)